LQKEEAKLFTKAGGAIIGRITPQIFRIACACTSGTLLGIERTEIGFSLVAAIKL
jgi:hypothetical protein